MSSGGIGLGDGESFVAMRRVIPDFTFRGTTSAADLSIDILGKDFPLNTETLLDTASIDSSTGQYHLRARAREVIVKITTNGSDYGWTLGDLRFDIRTDGRR